MKKGLKILLIIIVIIVIILIGLGIFMSIKGNKKPISTEQFINITTELGYNTSKVTTSSTVIDSYTAKKDDYEIKFYSTSNELADKNYNRIKREYESIKDSTSVETNVSVEKYSKYTLTTNEYYMIVTKIDTTLIFAKVSKNYKNNVNDTLEKLGY